MSALLVVTWGGGLEVAGRVVWLGPSVKPESLVGGVVELGQPRRRAAKIVIEIRAFTLKGYRQI